MYQQKGRLDANSFITDPTVPDPEHLPEPVGWNLWLRPYPIENTSSIIMSDDEINFMNAQMNLARVVSVGPCCWNRPHHKNAEGERFEWVKVGDFVAYPKHVGVMRKFKGVSYVIVSDDEIVERLPDPMVLSDEGYYKVNIPQEDLEKYNTIYNEGYQK